MVKFILISMISCLLGIFTIVFFSAIKVSSKCSRIEEKTKNWYKLGQDVYQEIKKEKNIKKYSMCKKIEFIL